MNPHFQRPIRISYYDADEFSRARAAYLDVKSTFLDRLLCAEYFDALRFEAMLAWLEELRQFHEAIAERMERFYFDDFNTIENHLDIQRQYSRTQAEICELALHSFRGIREKYRNENGA